jgi:hypothetical protein
MCIRILYFFKKELINLIKPRNFNSKIESLDACEQDEDGFIDGDVEVGRSIASFSFGAKPAANPQPVAATKAAAFSFGKMSFNASTRGATPAVDGEAYTIKRCYQYRSSTVRKLNELKANHSDVNVYLNTIIDEAISHYYEHVFHRKPTS